MPRKPWRQQMKIPAASTEKSGRSENNIAHSGHKAPSQPCRTAMPILTELELEGASGSMFYRQKT